MKPEEPYPGGGLGSGSSAAVKKKKKEILSSLKMSKDLLDKMAGLL